MENKAPVKEAPVRERKKVNISQIILWAAILIVFLLLTNPSLIPFLSQDAKTKLRESWSRLFGDVGKISQSITISWISLFQVIAVILAVILIYKILSFALSKIRPKSGKGRSLVSLLRSALSYILVIIGIIWCFSAIGVNISTIFAGIGILALIIGFGAQ
ncbi:MAG: mechanosensitive ion channel, partial [Firmicutes bacterium]|nr:mechanosensitive ion channel [Bacillota bacterium]